MRVRLGERLRLELQKNNWPIERENTGDPVLLPKDNTDMPVFFAQGLKDRSKRSGTLCLISSS